MPVQVSKDVIQGKIGNCYACDESIGYPKDTTQLIHIDGRADHRPSLAGAGHAIDCEADVWWQNCDCRARARRESGE